MNAKIERSRGERSSDVPETEGSGKHRPAIPPGQVKEAFFYVVPAEESTVKWIVNASRPGLYMQCRSCKFERHHYRACKSFRPALAADG